MLKAKRMMRFWSRGVAGGMLGVTAMAMQNALVKMTPQGTPSTAVMTTNVTRFVMSLGEVLLGCNPGSVARARTQAKHSRPAIIGSAAGWAMGAVCEWAAGLSSLALPTGLALWAFAIILVNTAEIGQSE
jgi:uncharacterized membrane protein YoaK (UPF0700 family)